MSARVIYQWNCTNRECRFKGTLTFQQAALSSENIPCPFCKTAMTKEMVAHNSQAWQQIVSTTTMMSRAAGCAVPLAFNGNDIGASSTATTAKITGYGDLSAGDCLLIGTEILRVTAKSSTNVTFTRNFAGTTRAAHSSTNGVVLIGLGEYIGRQKAASGIAASSTATTLTLDAGYATMTVGAGDHLRLGTEVMKASAQSTSAITVVRGQWGTTRQAHSTTAVVYLLRRGGRVTPPSLVQG